MPDAAAAEQSPQEHKPEIDAERPRWQSRARDLRTNKHSRANRSIKKKGKITRRRGMARPTHSPEMDRRHDGLPLLSEGEGVGCGGLTAE